MRENMPEGVGEVPKPTRFKYPEGKIRKGTVIKEVGAKDEEGELGEYYGVIQLIEWEDGEKSIRFGYYRKKPRRKKFKWASQTTFDFPVNFTKELIEMAKAENIL